MGGAVGAVTGVAAEVGGKRRRRSYSEEEKRRMVAEAGQPGVSVADVARRNGVNANLLFNWRRLSREAASAEAAPTVSPIHGQPGGTAVSTEPPAFISIGVFGQAEDEGSTLIAGPRPAAGADRQPAGRPPARPVLDERPGMIEVALVDGTRLRVDAFINERSLRRVLAALKAAS